REPHLGPHPHAAAVRALASRAVPASRLHPLSQFLEGGRRAYARQAGDLFQQRLLPARTRAAAPLQHADRQAHGRAAHFAARDDVDGDAGAHHEWARPARAGVPPPRGAGLQRRCASRGRARQPAGPVQLARHRQIYSSARDMAVFLAANLGALPDHRPLQEAMALAQTGMFTVNPRFTQALAWQVVHNGDITFVDKNGGLSKTPTPHRADPPKTPALAT